MENQKKAAVILISIGTLFWGSIYVSTKFLLERISSEEILFFRYLAAATFLFVFMKIRGKDLKLEKKSIMRIVISSALGINLCFYFQTVALKSISVSMAGLFNGTIPILTLIAEIIFFGKKVTRKIIMIFLLSTLGIYLTVIDSSSSLNGGVPFKGYLFMLLGIICWIAYTFITEPLSSRYSSPCVLTYQSITATILMLPFVVKELFTINYFGLFINEKAIILNLLYMGIFCTAIAFGGFVYSVSVLGPSTTAIFTNFIPIVSMLGGYFVFGEMLTFKKLAGAGLVILSIFLINSNISVKSTKSSEEELCEV
ncbi:DMT family transporter [Wukongibacter baidiensis]